MGDIKDSIKEYFVDTARYFIVIFPALVLFYMLDANLFAEEGMRTLTWLQLVCWIWLMKEVSYWTYIREMNVMQWIVKWFAKNEVFEFFKQNNLNAKRFTLLIRLITKIMSWLFIFILSHTWIHMTGLSLDYVFIVTSSIIFYMGIELRIMLKMAYIEYISNSHRMKQPNRN